MKDDIFEEKIRIKGKIVSDVFIYLDYPRGDKEKFVEKIFEKTPLYRIISSADYIDKNNLKKSLYWSIFGFKQEAEQKKIKIIKGEDIIEEIKDALIHCLPILNKSKLIIFVFPTFDSFIIKEMRGVSGFSAWKNIVQINIYPTNEWKIALKETVVHEVAHAIALNFNKRVSLQDDLIFEGIAEHFCENILSGKKSKFVKSISKIQAKQILQKIKGNLAYNNKKLYQELFFGMGEYPQWAGYAIGYYIVENYLKKLNKIDWKELIKTPPYRIIKKNNFLSQTKSSE